MTKDQMLKTERANPGRGGFAKQFEYDNTKGNDVCADHAFMVIKAHVEPVARAAGVKESMLPRELIHDLLWATGTHEKCPVVDKESLGKRRRPESKPAASDELTETFMAVRPHIHKDSFTYNFMLTQMRQLMVLKEVEGMDVLHTS